ncbi:MAG: acetyl-CoA C-acetyltransferase [Chloroflexota bacterium]|nr:MAG: acetyl-CoA C-acetyltransferase [Chloroflexota bacterium]
MPHDAYIYDAVRTPRGRGKADGSLHEIQPVDLLATVLRALQTRNNLDTAQVDDVVIGCVTPIAEQGGVIARSAVIHAGWATNVPGVQLDRFCASGLEAVNTAAMQIASGWHKLVVAGGVESMSRLPMGSDGGAWFMDPRVNLESGFVPQGISADLIATIENFSRDDVDRYALQSQQRAAYAEQNGYFKSRVPVRDQNGLHILNRDEHIRANTTLERLANLSPAFEMMGDMGFDAVALDRYPKLERIEHVHTAGNSSGIVDGAAAVLLGSKEMGERLGLKPRAKILAGAVVGTEPTIMLTGPAPASKKALAKAGMNARDIDLFEVNEAFAVVPMRFVRDMNLDGTENVNVNGGAIAMGHPLGATGAMLLGTLLDELERNDLETGLVTLCVGGGMGIATVVERV